MARLARPLLLLLLLLLLALVAALALDCVAAAARAEEAEAEYVDDEAVESATLRRDAAGTPTISPKQAAQLCVTNSDLWDPAVSGHTRVLLRFGKE